MFENTFFKRIIFNCVFLLILFLFYFSTFYKLYISNTIIISFVLHPFNLSQKYPLFWFYIKLLYIPITTISSLLIINLIYSSIFTKKTKNKIISNQNCSDLYINIFNETNKNLIIPEPGLYQNFLITGTIGSGKTSSVMYPFTKQLIQYQAENNSKKLGMLILDVKGNYYSQVKSYCENNGRNNDLIVIEIRSAI